MPVRAFTFPVPEIRFFQAGRHVFKIKITCGGNYSGEDMTYEDFANEELEDSIRIVLASLDTLQPFATKHFNIFPSTKQPEDWNVNKLKLGAYSCPSSPGRPKKRSKTEQPPERALLQPSVNSLKCSHQDSPEQADEAEEIVNDSQPHTELEKSLNSTQDDNLAEDLPSDPAGQTVPDKCEHLDEDTPGLLTRLARAAFPLSLFFKK